MKIIIGEYPYNVFKDKYKYTEGNANIKIYTLNYKNLNIIYFCNKLI